MSTRITYNSLYSDQNRKCFWRAIYQDPQSDNLAICQINEKELENSKLELVSLQLYLDFIIAGVFILEASDPFATMYFDRHLSEKEKAKMEKRLTLLEPALEAGIKVFNKLIRVDILARIAKEEKVPIKSLNRYLSLYFAKGCMPASLIPNYNRCGAPKIGRASSKKLGRPSLARVGMPLTKQDKALIKKGFIEFYANNRLSSLFDAYSSTINKYFISGQESEPDKLNIKLPSECQFTYWGKKAISPAQLKAKRYGAIIYDKDKKLLKGSANEGVFGPGSLYQIDSTQADINLISTISTSDSDADNCIGRPTLYILTDVYTRMIVGFTISLENASYVSAALALHAACENKVELCKKYGISIETDDWPCSGLPNSLLADRGELKGELGNTFVNNLGITLKTAKSYRPDWKGNVETLFKTMQFRIKKSFYEKGAITKLDSTRIGSDSRVEAVITLDELNRIVTRFVVDYNKYHYIESYPLSEDMVLNKIKPIPCELWKYGCQAGLDTTRQIDSQKLYLNVLPRKMASLDKEGVKFMSVDYTTKSSEVEEILNNKLAEKIKRLEIAYDPRNVKKIFLVLDNRFYELEPRKSQLMDRDIWDYQTLAKNQRKEANEQRKIEAIIRGFSDEYTRVITEESQCRQKGKVNKENIRENRKKDITEGRQNIFPEENAQQVKPKATSNIKRKSYREIINKLSNDKS